MEVCENNLGDMFRAVYTVTLGDAVYVLHSIQKKSVRGIQTPKRDIDLIRTRLVGIVVRQSASNQPTGRTRVTFAS